MAALNDPRHERFAQELAAGKRVGEAFVAAGYSAHRSNPSRLARSSAVRARVSELLAGRAKIEEQATERAIQRVAITKQRVLQELAAIGFANIADLTTVIGKERVFNLSSATREQLAAVQALVVEDVLEGRGENQRTVRRVRLTLADKRQALVDIGKELGMFIARSEAGKPGEFAHLTDEQLSQKVVDELVLRGLSEEQAWQLVRVGSGRPGAKKRLPS